MNHSLIDLFKNTDNFFDELMTLYEWVSESFTHRFVQKHWFIFWWIKWLFTSESVNHSLIDLFKNTDSFFLWINDSLRVSQWIIHSSICSKTLIHFFYELMTLYEWVSESFTHRFVQKHWLIYQWIKWLSLWMSSLNDLFENRLVH